MALVLIQSMAIRGQVSDTLALPEFEIKSVHIRENYGFKMARIDSGLLIPMAGYDLATVISQNTTIFVKNYGNGTLSTPAFRGTSANHTQVLWNGIPLNSPMLGQVDLSQVPVSQFDALELSYGPSGITKTSGAFGGVIDLTTNPNWDNRQNIFLSQRFGSFGTYISNANMVVGNATFQSHTKFNFTKAQNNFPFTSDSGERIRQQNGDYDQIGVSQEVFFRWKKNHLISIKYWYSQDYRNLPPTTENYDIYKSESLSDQSVRGVIDYKYVQSAWNLNFRTMINDQVTLYQNNLPVTNSAHHFTSWLNKLRVSWNGWKNVYIKGALDFSHDRVESVDYEQERVDRYTLSAAFDIRHDIFRRFKSSLALRNDLVSGTFGTPIGAIGLEYRSLNGHWSVGANLSRNYRFPTLNDLYWENWGNPDLKPETNYSMEIGTTWLHESHNREFNIGINATAYNSRIYDMIVWAPSSENSSQWKPENVDEIWNRGVESGLTLTWRPKKFLFSSINNYGLCKSTYEKVNNPDDEKLGKQQIFIPVHQFNSTITAEAWNFFLTYKLSYQSDRFTGKDNADVMPGFSLSNIIFGRNIKFKDFILTLQLDINNLFNLDYQSLPSRPMPGINQMLTIRFNFTGER